DYSFAPLADWNGAVPQITYTTHTGASSTLDLTVTAVDDASVLGPDVGTGAEDTVATGNVLTNDIDVDSALNIASFSVASVPGTFTPGQIASIAGVGLLTVATNGDYIFTPNADWNGAVPQVTYITNTGSSSALDISVLPGNDAPVADDELCL